MKKKKRELIIKYDECDIFDSELAYRLENLGEMEQLIEKVMTSLDLDMDDPDDAKLQKLFDDESYEELSAILIKDRADKTKEVIEDYLRDDSSLYQFAWDDCMLSMNDEWEGSSYHGWFKLEPEGEYKYYDTGKDFICAALEGHQTSDFEAYREVNGSVTISVGSRSYTYIPVEVGCKNMLGKCVVDTGDDDHNIFKLINYSAFDGDHIEFEVRQYDERSKKLGSEQFTVSCRDFLADDDVKLMNLRDAVYVRRVYEKREHLRELVGAL